MLGLSRIGACHPVSPDELRAAVGERAAALPEAYILLMEAWGPGLLCGVVELPAPTSARFRLLQQRLWVDGAARRAAGAWGGLSDEALRGGVVLGLDRRASRTSRAVRRTSRSSSRRAACSRSARSSTP